MVDKIAEKKTREIDSFRPCFCSQYGQPCMWGLGSQTVPRVLTKRSTQNSAAEKRGLWEGVVQEPLRRALFCVFCVLSRFSPANLTEISFRNCPSNAGIFWKTPSRKTPKRSC